MRSRWISTLFAAALLALAAPAAQAVPITPQTLDGGLIETVADGCGPGLFLGRRGFCRPFGFRGGPRWHRGWYGRPWGIRRGWRHRGWGWRGGWRRRAWGGYRGGHRGWRRRGWRHRW